MIRKYAVSSATSRVLALALLLSACNSQDSLSVPGQQDPDRMWSVESNALSLNMLVGETYQLSVTARDMNGNVINPKGTISYRSELPNMVTVDSTGKVTAIQKYDGVRIFSSFTSESVTFTDTINVAVFSDPVSVESVEITTYGLPFNPVVYYKGYGWFSVTIKDNNGFTINGLVYSIKSLDKDVVNATPWYLYGTSAGKTRVAVEVNAFGRKFVDTVDVRVEYPVTASVGLSYTGADPVIAVNGSVTFDNYLFPQRDVQVIFDSNKPAPLLLAGDTVNVLSYRTATVKFTAPGIYRYTVPATNRSSAVIVRENPTF